MFSQATESPTQIRLYTNEQNTKNDASQYYSVYKKMSQQQFLQNVDKILISGQRISGEDTF